MSDQTYRKEKEEEEVQSFRVTYLDLRVVLGSAKHKAPDAAEAIDPHAKRGITDGGGGKGGLWKMRR